MAKKRYKNLQVSTPTSGNDITLAAVPTNHEYIGTVNICYVPTAGTGSTVFNMAVTTSGVATTSTANFRAYNHPIEDGEELNYTFALEAGKRIRINSPTGHVAAHFDFLDIDNA